jgi:hypothetical protein
MASLDRNDDRPPLKPSDVYRPRLGAQRAPLSRIAMSELRAWREAAGKDAATAPQPEHTAQALSRP